MPARCPRNSTMFRLPAEHFDGSFQQHPATTDDSTRQGKLSPSFSSSSLAKTKRSTSGGDNGNTNSFHDPPSFRDEALATRSPSYTASSSTSHLARDSFFSARRPPVLTERASDTASNSQSVPSLSQGRPNRNVSYLNGVPVSRMLATTNNELPPSYYTHPNNSLAGDFHDVDLDPPPLYDWVMMMGSRPPTQEQQPSTSRDAPDRLRITTPDAEHRPQTPPRAFSYGTISAGIMADFDFPAAAPRQSFEAVEVAAPSRLSSPPQRGYRPTAASILEDFDPAPFSPHTTGGSNSTAASTPPMMSPIVRPRSASLLGSNNPYVALLQQKEQAMTVAFLRSQEAATSSRSADLAADDFR